MYARPAPRRLVAARQALPYGVPGKKSSCVSGVP